MKIEQCIFKYIYFTSPEREEATAIVNNLLKDGWDFYDGYLFLDEIVTGKVVNVWFKINNQETECVVLCKYESAHSDPNIDHTKPPE